MSLPQEKRRYYLKSDPHTFCTLKLPPIALHALAQRQLPSPLCGIGARHNEAQEALAAAATLMAGVAFCLIPAPHWHVKRRANFLLCSLRTMDRGPHLRLAWCIKTCHIADIMVGVFALALRLAILNVQSRHCIVHPKYWQTEAHLTQ
jgi:hypothetical protein